MSMLIKAHQGIVLQEQPDTTPGNKMFSEADPHITGICK